jgi:glycosyltransferase involved in cell wall biosynthesis
MKVAIAHDWLVGGGAELVVEELHKMYPDAPIYTSYCTEEWRQRLDNVVITGYMQHWPFSKMRKFLPLLRQWWFSGLNMSSYDLVISSSGNGEARFVKTKKPALHISYCHSPTHFYWRHYDYYKNSPGFGPKTIVSAGLMLQVRYLRKRDYKAAQAVDFFIANSRHIQADIKTFYNRGSAVIYPPVNVKAFKNQPDARRHGFVTVGRQVPYKRVDLIVDACTKLNMPLKVLGSGPEHKNLVKQAGPTIEFVSPAPFNEVIKSVQNAEAFILAAFEDFGITPVEALAAGTPVIAYKAGGALDYVDSSTGVFFDKQTTESLVKAIEEFSKRSFNHSKIARRAEDFSAANFVTNFQQFVRSVLKKD